MAEATIHRPEVTVTLTISEDEAQALADVLAQVAGEPNTTRRGLVQEVATALAGVGITFTYPPTDLVSFSGGLRFQPR